MIHRERRKRPRPTPDPLGRERDALIAAVKAAEREGPGQTLEALQRYAARARMSGLDMAQLVTEFRSVYDRSVGGEGADVRRALRRERLVTQLMGIYLRTG